MTYEELEKGLFDRGFVGIDEIGSCGKCHKSYEYKGLKKLVYEIR